MSHWTISRSCLSVLLGLLFLIVLIVVLPDVDLPDTAFHGGTAPVDVHSRVTSGPALLGVGAAVPFDLLTHPASRRTEQTLVFAHDATSSLPLLHRALRC
jgi:hypothetical protein